MTCRVFNSADGEARTIVCSRTRRGPLQPNRVRVGVDWCPAHEASKP